VGVVEEHMVLLEEGHRMVQLGEVEEERMA